ncbi:M20/M25/M40 family metallo-hydrolase [Desulfosediminicola ganghwensis]|uniref:M20/M25/M40 family metallo-hydrolase n=1 Tax=Desulfosediminicola ganghwensis TaxID=2569540 RepID=UPI0010AC4F53|nr:M20/M25/M40 family metallo-hydrolase [Desulfosediminicola ganghwensis]
MRKTVWGILAVSLAIFSISSPLSANQSGLEIPVQITGESAYRHVQNLAEGLGARVTGTPAELEARFYVIMEFESMGYDVEVQPFTYERGGETYESANIVATREGKFDQAVILGAHYDSVSERICDTGEISTGAGDNASGVGVMLEVAETLTEYKTLGTIRFIAFGGEEMGLHGSQYYANQMTEEEIENTAAMINLDSVSSGDYFYVYSGVDDNPGWVRDLALSIGNRIGYDLRTSPGSDYFEYGTTGDWSDHVPFRLLGIPIAYFEWMNWDIEPDGGVETEEFGWIMHTCRDNIDYASIEKLELTADVVGSLVFELSKTKLPKAVKGKVAQGKKYVRIQKRNNQPD